MHPRGVNPPTGSRYYARRPADPADEPPFRCHGKLRQGRKSILQEGFAVTLDYAIAGAVSMDNRHRGGGADGEGKGTLPPHPSRRVTGSVFRRTPPPPGRLHPDGGGGLRRCGSARTYVPAGGSSDQGTVMKKTGFMPSRALAGPQSKKLIPG